MNVKEVLINSGAVGLLAENVQTEARIEANSRAMGKICNEDMCLFRRNTMFHE